MGRFFTNQDRQRIFAGIQGKYRQAAQNPLGLFRFPAGRQALELLGYPPDLLACLPGPALESYCGVENPSP